MSVKIILDTNVVMNRKSFDQLLGNREALVSILDEHDTTLMVPTTVIDELIFQKACVLQAAKQRLIDNIYYKQLPEDVRQAVESSDLDESALRADQSILFTEFDIRNDVDAFAKIRKLATSHDAPFAKYNADAKENTDKGFKDACIALTIDDYLTQLDDGEKVLFVTNDARLAEYFEGDSRVVRVRKLEEVHEQIQVVSSQLSANTMAFVAPRTIVKAPSKERISIQKLLTEFRNTSNFKTTHLLTAKLSEAAEVNSLTDDDYIDILTSAAQNDQINWLLDDTDIKQFIQPIFEKFGDQMNIESYNVIASGLGVPERKRAAKKFADLDDEVIDSALEGWIEIQS